MTELFLLDGAYIHRPKAKKYRAGLPPGEKDMSGSILTRTLKFCDAQCLPVGLVSATLLGLAAPSLGVEASKLGWLAKACVPLIFCELRAHPCSPLRPHSC